MQTVATQAPANVITHVVTVEQIGALKGRALDSALTKLFFGNTKGAESHEELWQAVAHIYITYVTNGGNKAALTDPSSKRAQESAFYSHLHAEKGKTVKVKALKAAIEAARPYAASGAAGEELAQILSVIKSAFFGVLPQAAPRLPCAAGIAPRAWGDCAPPSTCLYLSVYLFTRLSARLFTRSYSPVVRV